MARPTLVAAAGCLALAAAMGIGRFAFTPMLPAMLADGSLTLVQGSNLALANYLGYLVGALLALAWPGAPRGMLLLGLALVATSTAAMAAPLGLHAWWAWRALAGVASAWALVGVSSWALRLLAQCGAQDRAGLVFAGVGLGIAGAGALVPAVLAPPAQVPSAWLALGAVAAAAALAVGALLAAADAAVPAERAPARTETESAVAASRDALSLPPARPWPQRAGVLLAYGAMGYGYILPATYLPTLAQRALEPAHYALVWPVFGLAAAASTWAAGPWSQRLGARGLWWRAQLAMAGGVAAPWLLPAWAGLLASAVLVGGSFMVVTMVAMQHARELDAGGRLMAAMTASFALGQVGGPWAVRAWGGAELGAGPAVVAAAALVASGLWLRRTPAPAGAAGHRGSRTS